MPRLLALSVLLALSLPSIAVAVQYQALVDLPFVGGNTEPGAYLTALFRLLIGIAGVLAVVRLVWCGFKAIMSPVPSARQEASQCLWGAITGLLLAVSAWLILSQVNPSLVSNQFAVSFLPGGAGAPGGQLPGGPGGQLPGGQLPGGQQPGPGGQLPGGQLPGGQGPGGQQPPAAQCDTRNLCEPEPGLICGNAACDAYFPIAQRYQSGSVSAQAVMSIMFLESSCNIAARTVVNEGGVPVEHCGLMQLSPATANMYLGQCAGVIPGYWQGFRMTCNTLRDPQYAEASICLAAAYLDSITQNQYCREDPRFVYAAYNGGTGVCADSADCAGDRGCTNLSMRIWECPYDDPARAICNAGPGSYEETRDFVRRATACTLQFFDRWAP